MKKFKNIKERLSGALCIILTVGMLGILPVCAVEEPESIVPVTEAGCLALGLGIMKAEDYRAEEYISRGSFAASLAACYRVQDEEYSGGFVFDDVDAEYSHYNQIGILYEMGCISGYEDGTFRPEQPIRYDEALFTMLDLAGSGQYVRAALREGAALLPIASQRGLTRGISAGLQNGITYEQAAQLIYNTLHTDMMELTSIGETASYQVQKDKTVLEARMELLPVDGVLSGVGIMNLKEEERLLKQDEILIDDVLCVNAAGMEFYPYFGMSARFYVEDTQEEKQPVVYADFDVMQNRSITIDAQDITGTELNRISYTDEQGKSKSAALSDSMAILYNGRPLSGFVAEDLHPRYGSVTLIDNDGGGYDVLIIREVETYIIEQFSDMNGTILGKYNSRPLQLRETDAGHAAFYTSAGKEMGNPLYNCSVGDVLEVMTSRDGKYLSITATLNQSKKGKLTKLSKETAVINGEEFKLSRYFRDLNVELRLEMSAEFHLNSAGEIVGCSEDYNDGEKYGYMTAVAQTGVFEPQTAVKLFTAEGKMETYTLADKVQWDADGTMLSDSAVAAALGDTPQLIRYKCNGNGEINSLRIAVDNTAGDERFDKKNFSLDFRSEPNKARIYNYTIGANYSLTGQTVVFIVPEDVKQEKVFRAGGQSMMTGDIKQITIELYDTDETGSAGVLVRKTSSGGGSPDASIYQDDVIVVDEVMEAVIDEENGIRGTKISGYQSGKKVEFAAADDEVVNYAENNYWSAKYGKYSGMRFSDIQRGDIIGVELDVEGKVSGFLMYLSSRDLPESYAELMSDGGTPKTDNYLSVTSTHYGVVKKCYTKAVLANANGTGTDNAWNRTFSIAGATIYYFDREKDELSIAGIGDISEGDLIFVRAYYRVPKDVVIIK